MNSIYVVCFRDMDGAWINTMKAFRFAQDAEEYAAALNGAANHPESCDSDHCSVCQNNRFDGRYAVVSLDLEDPAILMQNLRESRPELFYKDYTKAMSA
jgi:hypothetical protein